MKVQDLKKVVAILETRIGDLVTTLIVDDKGEVLFKATAKSLSFREKVFFFR